MTKEAPKQEQGEPVGWIDSKGNMICTKINESCKPLYTTPQGCDECGANGGYALYCLECTEKFFGTKEWVSLTDEEIEKEWFKTFSPEPGIGKNVTNGIYEFANAILRKAQSK